MPAMNIIPCHAGNVQTLAGVVVQSYLEEYPTCGAMADSGTFNGALLRPCW